MASQSLQSKKNRLKIQELSQQPLVTVRFPTVQPEWAFELIITGLDNYDATVLDNYFSKSYVRDGQTLWVSQSYRCYCFLMEDWDATLQVLRDKDKLEARCSTSLHNIGFPRLIFEAITANKFHESIVSAIT